MMPLDQACRVCGCTDTRACITQDGPCWWVEEGLCSACDGSGPPKAYGDPGPLGRAFMVIVLIVFALGVLALIGQVTR